MKIVRLLFLLLLLPVLPAMAQDEPTYKREIGVGVGLANYLGDFNGSLTKGFGPQATVVYRRVFTPYSALKFDLGYVGIDGKSSDVKTYYPDYAQEPYSFSRTLLDLNAAYEYNFWPYGTGRDYRGAVRLTPFVFIGLGGTLTLGDPKTDFALNMPIGLGVKYKISPRMNLSLEWAVHFTLSDKLDGVADPYHIESSGIFKNTDGYSALRLCLTYSFSANCPTCNKDY